MIKGPSVAQYSRANTIYLWRTKRRFEAYGLILSTAEKRVSNKSLAEALGMAPRGLRQVLERDPHFIVELRGEKSKTECWFAINPDHEPLRLDQEEPPALKVAIPGGPRLALTDAGEDEDEAEE